MDYFDILLARNLANKGDITTESLSVTQNGTYTAPQGKAYTPVTVSVQPPANSYQLKSITTPTSLATFEASAMPMPTLKASIKAKQDSGTPSPSNPLPISGWDAVKVSDVGKNLGQPPQQGVYRFSDGIFDPSNTNYAYSKSKVMGNTQYTVSIQNVGQYWGIVYLDDNENFISSIYPMTLPQTVTTPSNCRYLIAETGGAENPITPSTIGNVQIEAGRTATTYEPYNGVTTTISLPQTVYGGEVDVVNGTLTVTHKSLTIDENTEIARNDAFTDFNRWTVTTNDAIVVANTDTVKRVISNRLSSSAGVNQNINSISIISSKRISMNIANDIAIDITTLKAWLSNNNIQAVYELNEPITYQLTPTLIKSLNGTNNLSVDCGEILEGTYFKALGGA